MGWAKAEPKHLAKYAELLAHQGYCSVRSTLPLVGVLTLVDSSCREHTLRLLDFMQSQRLLPRR